MDAQRWAVIEPLYHGALAREPAERAGYLEVACPKDPTLRKEVESLLAYADAALAGPASESQPATLWGQSVSHALTGASSKPGNTAPAAIGRYRIIRLLGEGGMGVVYEAEQEQPRRTVALKIIKPGLAGPELLRRFEQESQALARLQHPGIAQIYEAGTADGGLGSQPYFAMELIRGPSLREYLQSLELNVRQRLELMIRICDAVHHAHERGVIHRDLKPGNILVDAAGQPKILDFGVARSTDSDAHATRQTDLGQLVGTLAYMSPEQVLGDPVELDTRSDVYALGVILYELLAGRLPYQIHQKLHQAVQTIREEDPARLSSINRVYRGDVETIVAKALEKDKARRYASAAGLADDIRHYLQDEPIVARPASAGYQLSKFVRRHRALAAGVSAVFIVLVGGFVASTWQAARATEAQHRALLERDRAATAEQRATNERDRALTAERTATAAEAQALQDRNRALAEKKRADTEADTAKAVNDFLRNDLLAQAGASSQSGPGTKPDPDFKVRTALDRAAARMTGKFYTQPTVEASLRHTIGEAYIDLGLYSEAQREMLRALDLRRRALGEENPETLASAHKLATVYRRLARYSEAEALLVKVIVARRRALGEENADTLSSMGDLAVLYLSQSKYKEAETLLVGLLSVRRRVSGEKHPDTLRARNNLAAAYSGESKYAQAEQLYQEVLQVQQGVQGEEHPDTLATMGNLAAAYQLEGKYSQAEVLHIRALEAQKRVLGEDHPRTLTGMLNLGVLYRKQRRYGEAEPLLTKAADGRRRVLGDQHPDTLAAMRELAELYRLQGGYLQAERLFNIVLEARRRLLGNEHPATVMVLNRLGGLRLDQRKYGEAEPLLREALASQEKSSQNTWERYDLQSLLGASLAGQGKYDEAEPLLLSGYRGLVERTATIPWENRSAVDDAADRIVQLYEAWGKPEQAADWRNRQPKP